jgi:hypothetical protein
MYKEKRFVSPSSGSCKSKIMIQAKAFFLPHPMVKGERVRKEMGQMHSCIRNLRGR